MSEAVHRNVSWIYQARRVATQANAGGGKVKVDISVASGQIARVVTMRVVNSGNNGILGYVLDEDNATHIHFCNLAAVAAATYNGPQTPANSATATASNGLATTEGLIVGSGQTLTFEQSGNGAQNDTMTIAVTLELFNLPTDPTWSKARSDNQADVTLAASTISAANTLTAGRIWT